MKKSKIMKALLVFGMSMVTATAIVGFTACNDEHDHVDADNNGKCDICNEDMPGSGPETPLKVAVEKVELNKTELTLEIGGEETLTATVTPDNADNKTVTWTSDKPDIATVSNSGKVTAVAAGTATITATADGKSATCSVTVNAPAPKPEVTKEEWEAALSESTFTNFTATVKMSDAEEDEPGDLIKVDLANGKYYSNGDYYSNEDGNYYKYSKADDSEEYTKEESSQDVYDGELADLYPMYVIHFKDIFENENVGYNSEKESYVGTNIDIGDGNTYGIEFKFDNGKLIYADIDYGEDAHILIQYSDYGTTTVDLPTVGGEHVKVDVEKVELNKAELTLKVGGDETLTATVTPDNADDKTVSWTSSDPSVATVDNSGKVTAVAAGTATITATADGKSATCSVTVNTPDPGELPNITEWAEVGDPIYGIVSEADGDKLYHHIFFNDVEKKYDFDSYEVTVTLDGEVGEVIAQNPFDANVGTTHTYHMHVRIKGTKYQTAVFTINFKKDGKTVATGTYTRVGDKEIALDSVNETISVGNTTTINITSINGSSDLTGKTIKWTIADTEGTGVATIPEDSNGNSVVVTAVAAGKATLTCTVGEGEGAFSKTCAITVQEGAVVIEAVDLSEHFVFNNKFTTSKEAIQVRCELNGKTQFTDLAQQIDPSQTTVTVTMDGQESTGNIIHKQWQAANVYNLYIQVEVESNWEHDYVFRFSLKNSKGVEVAYGTYSETAPKTLTLSKTKLNLTLKEGETVTEVLTATKTSKVEGDITWTIDDNTVASIVVSEDKLSVTVTAVAKGTATITATVDGLTQTCTVNVLDEDDTPPAPESDFDLEFHHAYGDWWIQFTIKKAPDGFTSGSYDYVKIYADDKDGVQQASNYFANTNEFQVYCATSAGNYASEYKFEFYKGGAVVATAYWTNNGTATNPA